MPRPAGPSSRAARPSRGGTRRAHAVVALALGPVVACLAALGVTGPSTTGEGPGTADPSSAGPVRLDSVAPSRQRVYAYITLRGEGFGPYTPGTSEVVFETDEISITGGTPYVWRDDVIRIRVPAGDRIGDLVQPIPRTPLRVSVVAVDGTSGPQPFDVIAVTTSALSFVERTEIVSDRDVSKFLGAPVLNLARTKDAEVGDVNGDGYPDLVDNNSNNETNRTHCVLRINEGGGSFSAIDLEPINPGDEGVFATTIPPGGDYMRNATTYDADLADLDNDGLPDYIQTAARGADPDRLRILMNNHEGVPGRFLEDTAAWLGSQALDGCPDDLAHADVDNDGWVDVAVCLRTAHGDCGGDTSTVLIFLNEQGQSFADPITLSAPSGISSHDVFFLDANDDGYKDVFMVNETGSISQLFLHDGKPEPGFVLHRSFGFAAHSGDAADFNGDGLDDFALASLRTATVFLNDPDEPGAFTPSPLPDVPTGLYDLEPGDINLDGAIDVVGAAITNDGDDTVRIWINDGEGNFTNVTDPGAGVLLPGVGDYQRLSADLLDVDLDGDLDLYIVGADGQDVGDGNGFGRVPNQFYESTLRCRADVDGNDVVDFADLLPILSNWGPYEPCPPFIPADVDESCAIDFGDLLGVLSDWGPCP